MTAFLANFFKRYVEYDFTADLEAELDDVSAGDRDYKDVLTRFWRDFSAAIAETADLRIGEVLEKLDEFLAPHLYPRGADGGDPRICPTCGTGRLHLKTARSVGPSSAVATIRSAGIPDPSPGTRKVPRRTGGCWGRTRMASRSACGRAVRPLRPAGRGVGGQPEARPSEPAEGVDAGWADPGAGAGLAVAAPGSRQASGGRGAGGSLGSGGSGLM